MAFKEEDLNDWWQVALQAGAQLRTLCATSTFLLSMLDYVLLGGLQDDQDLARWKTLAQTIAKKTSNSDLEKYYASRSMGQICYADPFNKPFCLQKHIWCFNRDALHVKLFIILVRLARRTELPIADLFQDAGKITSILFYSLLQNESLNSQ